MPQILHLDKKKTAKLFVLLSLQSYMGKGALCPLFPFSFNVPFKCSTATLSEHRKISKEVSLTFMSGSVTDAHRHPEVPTGNCEASIWAKLRED